LSYASLTHAQLNDAFLFGADLRHANLQGANLIGAYLYGSDVQETKLPDTVGLTLSAVKTTKNWRDATFTGHLCDLLPLPRHAVTVQAEQPMRFPVSTPYPTLVAWALPTSQATIETAGVWPTSTAIPRLNLPPLSSHDLTAIPSLLVTIPSTPFSLSTPYSPIYRYSSEHVEEGC